METPSKTSRECALIAARAADERKATDIVVVKVGDVVDVTDYFVIVTAANTPHVEARGSRILSLRNALERCSSD